MNQIAHKVFKNFFRFLVFFEDSWGVVIGLEYISLKAIKPVYLNILKTSITRM
jgi:hypothetical protein